MGALGASAPMLFKVVGASTHTCLANFALIHFHNEKLGVKLVPLLGKLIQAPNTFTKKTNLNTHLGKLIQAPMVSNS